MEATAAIGGSVVYESQQALEFEIQVAYRGSHLFGQYANYVPGLSVSRSMDLMNDHGYFLDRFGDTHTFLQRV